MAFTDDLITRVKADTAGFEAGMQRAGQSASGFGSVWEQVSKRFVLTGGDVVGAVQRLGRGMVELVERGGAVGDVMANASVDIRAAQNAVSGLVSKMDLAVAANRILESGLELTNGQFQALGKAAAILAQKTGTDTVTAMNSLASAIMSGSERAARPFGLVLGKVNSELSEFDQLLARRQDLVKQLTDKFGEAAVVIDDAGDSVGRARAAWEDLKDTLSRNVAENSLIVDSVEFVNERIQLASTFVDALTDAWRFLRGEMSLAQEELARALERQLAGGPQFLARPAEAEDEDAAPPKWLTRPPGRGRRPAAPGQSAEEAARALAEAERKRFEAGVQAGEQFIATEDGIIARRQVELELADDQLIQQLQLQQSFVQGSAVLRDQATALEESESAIEAQQQALIAAAQAARDYAAAMDSAKNAVGAMASFTAGAIGGEVSQAMDAWLGQSVMIREETHALSEAEVQAAAIAKASALTTGEAFKARTREVIRSLAIEAAGRAAMEFAMSLASLALPFGLGGMSAGQHFAAGLAFLAIAGGAASLAAQIGPVRKTVPHFAEGTSNTHPAPPAERRPGGEGQQITVINNIRVDPGSSPEDVGAAVMRSLQAYARDRGRRLTIEP